MKQIIEYLAYVVLWRKSPAGVTSLHNWVLAGAVVWASLGCLPCLGAATAAAPGQTNAPAPIVWNEVGAKATAQYSGGEALSVKPTAAGGMTLRCDFQRLAGEVTPGGLWLLSTVTNTPATRFSVVAAALGRHGGVTTPLPARGTVTGDSSAARFVRPGLTEEYSVSVDGVRQDFVVAAAPAGAGELRVELAVQGARAEAATNGARLVLAGTGRTLAYSRLRVVDATGRNLTARIEAPAPGQLAVCVNDAAAVYPVRIDPTFSDANWVALGSGVNGYVDALAISGSTVYVGGAFTTAGGIPANNIASWNGTSWSALGSGVNSTVSALAISGSTLYVGGYFSVAGGISANYFAIWNGTDWSTLGSGPYQLAPITIAVYNGSVYVGGNGFHSMPGGATYCAGIEHWDGTKWAGLSAGGLNYDPSYGRTLIVYSLAVYRNKLIAGGQFVGPGSGGLDANVALQQWDGTNWSRVGNWQVLDPLSIVRQVVVSDDKLYVAGGFVSTNYVIGLACYDGTNWSTFGTNGPSNSTTNAHLYTVAVSGSNIYVGGYFTSYDGAAANNIAKWDGTSWSGLGSGLQGVNAMVEALATSGNSLYVGGGFNTAGLLTANNVAEVAPGAVSAAHSTVSASPASVTADSSTASTITLTLKDAGDNPVSGKTVTLAQTSGSGSPVISAASGPADANGVVTFTVTSTTATTDVFTATDTSDSLTITQTASVTFTAGAVSAAHSTVSASPASVTADGTTTSSITVALKDVNANPVSGKTVALAKTSGAGSPFISAASGVSSGSGVVTFTVSSTTAATDVFTATDTTDALPLTPTASVTFTAPPPSAAQSTVSESPSPVMADGSTTSIITVTLLDASGNPVSGKTVTLAQTSGSGSPFISTASGVSSGSGVVTFTVSSTTPATDVFTATDTSDSVTITQTASVTFTAAAVTTTLGTSQNPSLPGASVTITATEQTNGVTATSLSGTVQFMVNDSNLGSPVALSDGLAQVATSSLLHGTNLVSAVFTSGNSSFGNSSSATLRQVVNTPPVAYGFTLGGQRGVPARIKIISGEHAPTDADAGDSAGLLVTAVTQGAHGTVVTDGTNITYTSTGGDSASDSFTYTVSDTYGGTATATVTMILSDSGQGFNQLLPPQVVGAQVILSFLGIPGTNYVLDRTFSLGYPITWVSQATNTAGTDGWLRFTNTPDPGNNNYWRTRYQP